MSSWMTRSIHLMQGSFSFTTCFFTIASNAMSGVNRPVLETQTEEKTQKKHQDKTALRIGHISRRQCMRLPKAHTFSYYILAIILSPQQQLIRRDFKLGRRNDGKKCILIGWNDTKWNDTGSKHFDGWVLHSDWFRQKKVLFYNGDIVCKIQ